VQRFAVSAIAVAARRANAVGAVRLVCERDKLAIELVRAGAFSAGFVPGAIVEARSLEVPYTAVRGLVRRGPILWLALDPAVATPYSRFALARFGDGPPELLIGAYRTRERARLSMFVAPVPLGIAAAALAPASLAGGVLGLGSVAVLVALASFALLRAVTAALTWGGPSSDRHADAFEAELSRRLGLAPVGAPEAAGPPQRERERERERETGASALPWRTPVAVAVASVCLVFAMAFLSRTLGAVKPPPRVTPLASGIATLARASGATSALPPGPPPERCVCTRADSPLWKDPLPSLAVLLSARDGGTEIVPGRRGYDFDVAAVNAGAVALHDVRIVVTFARRTRKGRRVGATDRGLYVAELPAGHAVKWRVRGPGTEMRLDVAPAPPLARGRGDDDPNAVAPADPDAFRKLLSANHATVRTHAAMMLAYLRDPSAREAAHALGAGSDDDERVHAAIARAAAPVFACDSRAVAGRLEACVMNGSETIASPLVMREVGRGGRTWGVPVPIPVHDGLRISVPLGPGDPPAELEIATP
jgi:hypothetical protein